MHRQAITFVRPETWDFTFGENEVELRSLQSTDRIVAVILTLFLGTTALVFGHLSTAAVFCSQCSSHFHSTTGLYVRSWSVKSVVRRSPTEVSP